MSTKSNGRTERNSKSAVIGEHFYQPPRRGSHNRVANIQTDPHGTDWNAIIAKQCYIPQTQRGTLDSASFDIYATIRAEIRNLAPREAKLLTESMRARGVGDPFLHVLLPDLNRRDKRLLIQAGFLAFKKETGISPQWFWPPETALDNETLEVLVEVGYKGVLCAPEQLIANNKMSNDNRPIILKLHNKSEIIALPFDRPVSSSLAFDDKSNADRFAAQKILPRAKNLPQSLPLIAWTDGETFGHHAPFADIFLHYLLTQSLPSMGIAVLGINDLPDIWEGTDYNHGRLRERTAWSCPHGNLIRWHGACGCDGGHHGGWKEHFSNAMSKLNTEIDKILDSELGKGWAQELATNFEKHFYFKGTLNGKSCLLAAKASALAAMTSCGTFFEDPGTSGNINFVFALQALENLKDAGFERVAQKLRAQMLTTLNAGYDTKSRKKLDIIFTQFANQ